MARTLVINNADFSVNKLDTVTLGGKSCTGISLDSDSASITAVGGTATLTATVTPADTTDAIVWSTSNAAVATVAGGGITAVGCGEATITVTCGSFSDSCSVTVTHIYSLTGNYALNRYLGKDSSKSYLNGGDLNNYAIIYSAIGENARRISYGDRQLDRYPILIPKGAKKIAISCTNFRPYGFWLDSLTNGGMASVAYALPKDTFGSAPSTPGSRTATIPDKSGDYANMDSVAFVVAYNGTISEEAMNEITITFTA